MIPEPATQSVLVVDDDEGVALTFSRMLRLHGYRVQTATNPETGLALATAQRPDAIILDLRMPIVGGLEFLRRLRSDTADRRTSVTIVTGDYFIEDLGSTNGTFVNRGRRLIPGNRQVLRDGDEIIVGKTFLRFHVTK